MKNFFKFISRLKSLSLWLAALCMAGALGANAAQYNLVHAFAGTPNDGANPTYGSSLIASGSMLYGVTQGGGVSNSGVLFGIRTNGTGLQILHSFNGFSILSQTASKNDGALPTGSPLLVGNTLYGMTRWGGSNSFGIGTVYSINTNGTGFQVLHHFGEGNDGYGPYGSLVLSGTNLYGLAQNGGTNSSGIIFSIGTNGTGYRILRSFVANNIDGVAPWGSLVASNSVLYGMTFFGGTLNNGTVFRMNDNGTGYQVLRNFTGTTTDGSQPYGSLIISDSTLYGMTSSGGANNVGTVFQIQTNGSSFQILHSFAATEGWQPFGDLTLSNSVLYGMTHVGGSGGLGSGVIFQLNTNGSSYQILHTFLFPSTTTDGSSPFGSLLLLGSKLYGMTDLGCSTSPNAGGIFAFDLAASSGPTAPTITTTSPLPTGAFNVAYSQQLAASGGTTPYTWALASGALPAGLKLSSTGLISGTPSAGTTANFSIKVTGKDGLSSTQAFSLTIIVPDVTPPTITITTPTAGQQLTNQIITIGGTASDNIAVTGIRHQLNGGFWIIGFSLNINNYTNWYYPNLVLTPGTNTLLAYALDAAGNHSKTNSVKFVYYVGSTLTVSTNGNGSISPSYNNSTLQVGANYSMTAKAATGFAFANWTDGNGVILTNGVTLKFTMSANLVLHANFVDITKPTLAITAPTASQRWSNAVFTVTGTAADNVAVTNVFYSLNNSTWTNAMMTTPDNNWTNWMASINLTPGTNTIAAFAVDGTGNRSLTNTVRMLYALTDVLTVHTNGKGTLTPAYNGVALQLGANYSMTAKTAKGFIFTNWSDGLGNILTNKSILKFTMASNLTFVANFADITKPTNGIGSPKPNQRWSNAVFTVTGKAGDNLAVSNIWYSLNNSPWSLASQVNGSWSNWTAQVSLTPGTNIIASFAEDTTGNRSTTNAVKFIYVVVDWAPDSLNGLLAAITPAGQSTFYIGCWTNTFSQFSTDTNNDNGVGIYTYTKLSTNTARLVVAYTAPPPITNDSGTVFLTFTTNNVCNFSNELNGVDMGVIVLKPQANRVPASFNGLKTIFINSDGHPTYVTLGNGTIVITNSDGTVDSGKYTAKQYSPVGTLLKVIQSSQTNIVELTFLATNHGGYFITAYDDTGAFNGVDFGAFALLSASVSNAPVSLAGRAARLWDAGVVNFLDFSADTFSKIATDTNENSGVGTYTYTNLGPKSAQVSIHFLAPPGATVGDGAVTLNFLAPNFCVFTNQDDQGSNYLGVMSFTTETNPVPATLAGLTLTATSIDGIVDVLAFNGDGTFSQTETGSTLSGDSTGTYTFTPYGASGAMLQLDFTGGVFNNFTAYVQTVFNGPVPGVFFNTYFFNLSNLSGMNFGNFTIQ